MNWIEFNAPTLLFHPATERYIYEQIIDPQVEEFLKHRGIMLSESIKIKGSNSISDLNFKKIKIQYIYNKLLKGIKTKTEKGFTWNKYYTITFDKKLATKKCSETGLMYNEMYLGKVPILFFIYFDLQEILDFVREYATKNK